MRESEKEGERGGSLIVFFLVEKETEQMETEKVSNERERKKERETDRDWK